MATLHRVRLGTLSFWQKMAIGLSAFIVLAFAQFALRGMADYRHAPLVMHLHGAAMLAWLGLLVTQSLLAGHGGIALHRRLGWASAVMVPLIFVLVITLNVTAIRLGIQPPFFSPAYFLALGIVSVTMFALLVTMAVSRRDQPDWHRRLMLGSTVILLDPALGRVLPMPFIMPWGEWLSLSIQLGVVAIVARHDRETTGRTHPATLAVAICAVLTHVLVELLAVMPWWGDFVGRIALARD